MVFGNGNTGNGFRRLPFAVAEAAPGAQFFSKIAD